MGLEAACTIRLGRKTYSGKATLEGEALAFRGDLRLDIPFERIREARVERGSLVVRTDDQEARFELGASTSEVWLRHIKEPKELLEKLELGPASRVAVIDIHDSLFLMAVRERAASVAEGRVPEGVPTIFMGADTRDALRKIQLLRARMVDTGSLWVIRPKGSKAISESEVLEALRGAGLVDTKVVAFSPTHTAHKAVVPLELRGRPVRLRPPIVSLPPGALPPAPRDAAAAGPRPTKGKAAKKKVTR